MVAVDVAVVVADDDNMDGVIVLFVADAIVLLLKVVVVEAGVVAMLGLLFWNFLYRIWFVAEWSFTELIAEFDESDEIVFCCSNCTVVAVLITLLLLLCLLLVLLSCSLGLLVTKLTTLLLMEGLRLLVEFVVCVLSIVREFEPLKLLLDTVLKFKSATKLCDGVVELLLILK